MPDPVDDLTARSGVAFGDAVRVRSTSETERAGLSGRVGTVHGHTTPSLGLVGEMIGRAVDDVAVSVYFDDVGTSVWLAADLVDFVDVQPGSQIAIAGKQFERRDDGSWAPVEGSGR